MAEVVGSNLRLDGIDRLTGFKKTVVDGQTFFVADCVAYTPEQLGLSGPLRLDRPIRSLASSNLPEAHVSPALQIGYWNKGSLAHELGHVLGLVHEHQRNDRDGYVAIGSAVATNANFRKHSASEDTIRTAYDFGSLMHYARMVRLNWQDVVTPQPGYENQAAAMGQRVRPSAHDITAIRTIYG